MSRLQQVGKHTAPTLRFGMMIDVHTQSNTKDTLRETTCKHKVFLARDPVRSVDEVSEISAQWPREDIQQTVDSGDLRRRCASMSEQDE